MAGVLGQGRFHLKEEGRKLTVFEIGCVARYARRAGHSVNEVADALGVDPSMVRRYQRLMEAPEVILGDFLRGALSLSVAVEIAKFSPTTREAIIDSLYPEITIAEVRRLAKSAAQKVLTVGDASDDGQD